MIFYAQNIDGKYIQLNAEESLHAIKVLRLQLGDKVEAVDGKGNFYKTEISKANHKKCQLLIKELIANYQHRPYKVHIAIAPTKNINRYEWFLEKATEIGIDSITPILCEHSERKTIKPERLQKVLVAAMKQSKKALLPQLKPLTKFADLLKKLPCEQCYIAHCQPQQRQSLAHSYKAGQSVLILIGPEGDFSETEVLLAIQHNAQAASLGTERLRTETAGIVATHTISIINELTHKA